MPEQLKRRNTGIRQLFFAAALVLVTSAAIAQNLPKAVGRVNDFANVIDPAAEAEIDRRIDELEQKTSSEIAVVTIQSLGGISVEEYANRLFHEWGVGQAKQDNGVLVLVSVNDHKMRIEVGYGLEGVLPDILAGQIIRDEFTPRFRENDYSGGIRNGVNRVIEIVEKHEVLTAEELAKFNASGGDGFPVWLAIPFFGLFIAIGFGMLAVRKRIRAHPQLLSGGRRSDSSNWTTNSWSDSGSSSSSSSSDSSSGSDSSFGGGDSGGGGASGDW